jgi:hypothetical protein
VNFIIRISLTLATLFILLFVTWNNLPRIMQAMAVYQLERLGYSDVEVLVSETDLTSTTISTLSMSDENLTLRLENLYSEYQLSDLMSGQFIRLAANRVAVEIKATDQAGFTLPEPAVISSILTTAWHNLMPAGSIMIEKLELIDETGARLLTASVDVRRMEQGLYGEVSLVDDQGIPHHLGINISPESGVGIQLLALAEAIENPLSVTLYPADSGTGLSGNISADLSALPGVLALSGKLDASVSYSAATENDKRNFSVSAKVSNLNIHEFQAKSAELAVSGSLEQQDKLYRIRFDDSSLLRLDSTMQEGIMAESATVHLPVALVVEQGGFQLEPGNNAVLELERVLLDDVLIPKMRISNITSRQTGDDVAGCSFRASLSMPEVIVDDIKLELAMASVSGDCPHDNNHEWTLSATTKRAAAENPDARITVNQCSMSAIYPSDGKMPVTAELTCSGSEIPGKMTANVRYDMDKEKGDVDFGFPAILPDSQNPLLASFIKDWVEPFDILSGDISVQGRYSWWTSSAGKENERLVIDISINDAGGFYESILFSGLNYSDRIELLPVIKSKAFADVVISDIDIGIPVNNVSAKLRYSKSDKGDLPVVIMSELHIPVMGGEVRGHDLQIDLNEDGHEFVLVVDGLSLEKIVALQQLEGLYVTGYIDGYIPVKITPDGVTVSDGKIVSQADGGVIRYVPEGGTEALQKSAMGSEMLFRIIEDLNYHSLSIDVGYQTNGDLDLALAIRGKSPKFDENRPIHFNLSLQQNVLKLLKGLRYADGLREEIDRNVQEYFRNTENPLN